MMRGRAWCLGGLSLVAGLAAMAACTGDDPVVGLESPDGATADGPTQDAAGDTSTADANADADAGPPRCNPSKAFDAPVLIAALAAPNATQNDYSARLALDETLVVFSTNRQSLSDVFFATRLRKEDPFGATAKLTIVTSDAPLSPALTETGLTLVFGTQPLINPGNIYEVTRGDTSGGFGTATEVTNVTGLAQPRQPHITPDGQRMVYVEGTGPTVIKESIRQGGVFQKGVAVLGLDTDGGGNVDAPVMSPDGLTLYFGVSDPTTGFDIWVAQRATRAANFDPPKLVKELSGAFDDRPSWISPDLCRLYLYSDRSADPDASSPPSRIYIATRKP